MRKRRKLKSNVERGRSMIIDASGLILGRLASLTAKRIIEGGEVTIINAEKAVISGNKKYIVERFKNRLGTRTLGSQKKAPIHQRRPDTYVRRVIRGMLPWKKPKGKAAYKRLRVYFGLPEGLRKPIETLPEAKSSGIWMTVGELMSTFGWKNPVSEVEAVFT